MYAGDPLRPHHQIALFRRLGQRLLHVDVLAGRQCLQGQRHVHVVAGGDDHGLDLGVGEHLAVVGAGVGHTILGLHRVGNGLAQVAHTLEARMWRADQVGKVLALR